VAEKLLPGELRDTENAEELHCNGAYRRVTRIKGEGAYNLHAQLMAGARRRSGELIARESAGS